MMNVSLTVSDRFAPPADAPPMQQPYSTVAAQYRPERVTLTRTGAVDDDDVFVWDAVRAVVTGFRLKKDGTPGLQEVTDDTWRWRGGKAEPPEWLAALIREFTERTARLSVAGLECQSLPDAAVDSNT